MLRFLLVRFPVLLILLSTAALAVPRAKLLWVRASGDLGTVAVELHGDRPLSFTTLKLTSPPRVVVDCADTAVGKVPRQIEVDDGTVRRIGIASAGERTARVVIELVADAEFEVRATGNRIEVRLPRRAPLVASAARAEASPPQGPTVEEPERSAPPPPPPLVVAAAEAQPPVVAAKEAQPPVVVLPPESRAPLTPSPRAADVPASAEIVAVSPPMARPALAPAVPSPPLVMMQPLRQTGSHSSPLSGNEAALAQRGSSSEAVNSPRDGPAGVGEKAAAAAREAAAAVGREDAATTAKQETAMATKRLLAAAAAREDALAKIRLEEAAVAKRQPTEAREEALAATGREEALHKEQSDADAQKRASLPTVALQGSRPAAREEVLPEPSPAPAALAVREAPTVPEVKKYKVATAAPGRRAPPAPRAGALSVKEKPGFAPTPTPPAAAHRVAEPARRLITGLGFRPAQGGEVIVHSDKPLEYGVSGENEVLLIHLPHTAIPLPNNRRPLDTRFFDGPVQRIVPVAVAGGTDVRIELREHADYEVEQQLSPNGAVLTVTFSTRH